jgi:4-carboxymuconolactone decarboxylase
VSASSQIVTGKKDGTKQSDYGTFGRYVETPVDRMSPEMLDAFEFTKKLRGAVPGPHKIWCSNPKLSKTIVPTGAYFQTQSTGG